MIEKFKEALKKGDKNFLNREFIKWFTSQEGWKDFISSRLDVDDVKNAKYVMNNLIDDSIALHIVGKKLQISMHTDYDYFSKYPCYYRTKCFVPGALKKFLKGEINLNKFKRVAKEIGEELKIIEDKLDILSKDLIPWLLSQPNWKDFIVACDTIIKTSQENLDSGLKKVCYVRERYNYEGDIETVIAIEFGNGRWSSPFTMRDLNKYFGINKDYDDILNEIIKRQDTINNKEVLFDQYFVYWFCSNNENWTEFLYNHSDDEAKKELRGYFGNYISRESVRFYKINLKGEISLYYDTGEESKDGYYTEFFNLDELV